MGFGGPEPFETAEATYAWAGRREPGFFYVCVSGEAQKWSSGFRLVRDPHWVGGLKIDVLGFTGPIGEGTMPYKVCAAFPGEYVPTIVVQGSNKTEVVEVKEIPQEESEDFLKSLAEAG